jgi:hypothetical protein
MFGKKKIDTRKAMQNIARQKMMRGQATDANMIQNFGTLGAGAASQALSNSLRGNMQSSNSNNSASSTNPTNSATDANKRKAAGLINTAQKSDRKNGIGGNILGAIGK